MYIYIEITVSILKITWLADKQHSGARASASTICFRPCRGSLGKSPGQASNENTEDNTFWGFHGWNCGHFWAVKQQPTGKQPVENLAAAMPRTHQKRVRASRKKRVWRVQSFVQRELFEKGFGTHINFLRDKRTGGGNSNIFGIFTPKPMGRWFPIWLAHIFQWGWFKNHQLATKVIHMLGTHKSCVLPICNQLFSAALVTWAP